MWLPFKGLTSKSQAEAFMSLEGAIAAHRFGLGARPGEIEAASGSPKAWLMGQLDSSPPQPQALDGQPFRSSADLVPEVLEIRKMSADQKKLLEVFRTYVQLYVREMGARFALGFTTERPFAERLVWFWSNHFTVSAQNPRDIMFAGAFEREAIRPNINGHFEDLLLAVVRHPAMLLYLDNAQSLGPDSMAGVVTGKGLNENLGRELMELHTLGVDGGYTQGDVIAMAKLLTGWSLDPGGTGTGFRYYPARHEPGAIVLRGKTYPGGEEGGIAAIKDLAQDPATARHIARKFAVQFIADDPPAASIERLQKIPNLEFRYLDYSKLTGNGIIHAKYMVIDASAAYVGSQNFDWRSFAHIHETGLRITDPVVVAQLQKIFEHDWQAQASIAQGKAVPKLNQAVVAADDQQATFLIASPNAFNPAGVGDSETELPKLLGAAKSEVRIQLLDYAPLSYGPNRTRPYYAVIDNAIRAALARGVKVKLMVSNWNTEKPAIAYLQSLALLPGMEIRIVTLPQAGSGFIPFARVIHSKTMEIDGQVAWIGTSNWSGGYLDLSRNLEIVLRNQKMAQRIADLHQQTWDSAYAQPIDVLKDYPKPVKGKE